MKFSPLILLCLFSFGCQSLQKEPSHHNLGFENWVNGLPSGWIWYSPNTLKKAKFTIDKETKDVYEGESAVKFTVERCSDQGGAFSPGFTHEFLDAPFSGPATYMVQFAIKHEGPIRFEVGSVSHKNGEMKTIYQGNGSKDWKVLQANIDIKNEEWLRVQCNMLGPGTFIIDDIQILPHHASKE